MTTQSPSFKSRFAIFTNSRYFMFALMGLGFLFIAGVIFEAGVAVGFHKADFSGRLGDNYGRTFGAPGEHFGMMGTDLANPHGAFGKVVSISGSVIVISTNAGPEQQVQLVSDTVVRSGRDTLATSTVTVGDSVIVFGTPSTTGTLEAKLIRIVPPQTTGTTSPY